MIFLRGVNPHLLLLYLKMQVINTSFSIIETIINYYEQHEPTKQALLSMAITLNTLITDLHCLKTSIMFYTIWIFLSL